MSKLSAYEYDWMILYGNDASLTNVIKTLNMRGQLGWRCIKIEFDNIIQSVYMIFEREHR